MPNHPKRTSTIQFSLVPEFSWWRTADGRRLLCVIEKHGRGQGAAYHLTHVAIIERGLEEKKLVPYETFAKQVNEGKLLRVYYSDVDVRDDLLTYGRSLQASTI